MARISKPPVPVKMYKHFAVVTVGLTATIALFADGENREAAASHIEGRQEQARVQAASQQITGAPRLVRADQQSVGAFGSEASGDFGQPMTETATSAEFSNASRSTNRSRQPLPNMTPEEVSALSQEEYDRLRRLYAAAGAIEDIDRSAQMSEVEAASARRMGHGGSDS